MNTILCETFPLYVIEYAELCLVAVFESFSETSVSYGVYGL